MTTIDITKELALGYGGPTYIPLQYPPLEGLTRKNPLCVKLKATVPAQYKEAWGLPIVPIMACKKPQKCTNRLSGPEKILITEKRNYGAKDVDYW
jgi:hypothetical protein